MGLAEIPEAKIQAIVVKHVLDPVYGGRRSGPGNE